MNGRGEPTDPAAEGRTGQHVRWKMLAGRHTECRHPYCARVEKEDISSPVPQMLPPRDHQVGRGCRKREGRVQRGEGLLALRIARRRDRIARVQHRSLPAHEHFEPFR